MNDIPDTVQRFIAKYIRSLDELEILLLLRQNPQKEWGAPAIAGALQLDRAIVEARLEALEASGLVAGRQVAAERLYRYDLCSGEHVHALTELAKWYSTHRVKVIALIFAQPQDKIQTFADAFRFRKEEEDK
jgi:hypothetical protein